MSESPPAAGTNLPSPARGRGAGVRVGASALALAIPTMIFYRHFRAKVDALVIEMEQQATKLVDVAHGERA